MRDDGPPPADPLRSLALALRDLHLNQARQAMKVVRWIEQAYGIAPAKKDGKRG